MFSETEKVETAPAASKASVLPHPCTLLSQKDGEEVLGAGAQIKRDSDTACIIEAANGSGGAIEVKIEPLDSDSWNAGKKMILETHSKEKSLSGIGDDADTFLGGIMFRKGNANVSVITTAYSGAKPKAEVAKYVADKVAAGL